MFLRIVLFLALAWTTSSKDITSKVFGNAKDMLPAAFGDFNSDEFTDLFVLTNKSKTIEILIGSLETEPLLKATNLSCTFQKCHIRSVVPGDYNGDAFMDVLVVTDCHREPSNLYDIHILWGGQVYLNCSFDEERPIAKTLGEPLALDCNNDFVIDLFGVKHPSERGFWVFNKWGKHEFRKLNSSVSDSYLNAIREPHSNAYLDLNNDNIADLFLTSGSDENQFEFWKGTPEQKCHFHFDKIIKPPPNSASKLGQSAFLDLEIKGKIDHIVPYLDKSSPKIYVYSEKNWHDLNVNFKDQHGELWYFFDDEELPFARAVSLRGGDYNMDGYPDLLATLTNGKISRTLLLENSPCTVCENFTRTFQIQWDSFGSNINNSVLGVFYDIFQDGNLDVVLVSKSKNGSFHARAFKNNLDYDANFVKVMVLTGLSNKNVTGIEGPLRSRKKTFSTNLPGPRISYKTVDQEGNVRIGVSAQLPQSAYYSMYLPYIMFALGRTPNFVENITVGFASRYREWPQIIPNSQMVIIPHPIENPAGWKVQLFVTPSKVIIMSGIALAGTCAFILVIIILLHLKEKKMDRLERLQEAYRFHFDAM